MDQIGIVRNICVLQSNNHQTLGLFVQPLQVDTTSSFTRCLEYSELELSNNLADDSMRRVALLVEKTGYTWGTTMVVPGHRLTLRAPAIGIAPAFPLDARIRIEMKVAARGGCGREDFATDSCRFHTCCADLNS
jgi:hypothetical protein